jgi:hypothetical protein
LPGEAGAVELGNAEDRYTDAAADMDANELHVSGQTCARCNRPILEGEDVRRRIDGTFQHDTCP